MNEYPFVVVSTLKKEKQEEVVQYLLELQAPVYLEAISGLREDPRLTHLRITSCEKLWEVAASCDYPIDSIIRIGGIPTFRFWRDLENKQGKIQVYSITDLPFSGLSWNEITYPPKFHGKKSCAAWLERDRAYHEMLTELFKEEAAAEPSLMRTLSEQIPENAMIFLGNSMPIREWDMSATYQSRGFSVYATRGLNGIDGQISTFLGLCEAQRENWAILGDLTTLYDLAGPWILPQLPDIKINLVVVNNGGGQIFSTMFPHKEFINSHQLSFKPLADLWGLDYEKWNEIPDYKESSKSRLIELCPDNVANQRFKKKCIMLSPFMPSMAS